MGPKDMRMETGEGSTMRNFRVCTIHIIYSGWLNLEEEEEEEEEKEEEEEEEEESKHSVKISLGRHRCRWEDNIIMHFKEIGVNTRNWIDSTQDRDHWREFVNATLKLYRSS